MTGVKTHCDRLESLGKTFLNRKIKFSGFKRDWGSRGGFRCFLVVNPSFFCLPRPWVFGIFSFRSRLPFWIFTLESRFLFHFSLFFDYPIMHLIIQDSSRTSGWFIEIFNWGKETTTLLIMKIFSRKNLFSPNINV